MGQIDRYFRFYEVVPNGAGRLFKISNGFFKLLKSEIHFEGELDLVNTIDIELLKSIISELPFKPYEHQLKAILGLLKNKLHLAIVATGGGKSLIAYIVLRYFHHKNKKILLAVPTIGLTSQMYNDFKEYGAPEYFIDDIKLIGGENNDKNFDKNITISTWQSLNKVKENINVDVILCDEAHTAKADVLQSIIMSDIETKLGMTGSLPIIPMDLMSLQKVFGEPVRYVNARELMRMNLLTDTDIHVMYLNHPRKDTRSGMKYQAEVKFIKESLSRRQFVKEFLQGLSVKGVTVALYAHTSHGEDTFESLTGVKCTMKVKNDFELQKKLGVFFMSGASKADIREEIRIYLNRCENAIVIGQMAVLSTGINIPRLKNLVFLSSSKSYTLILQSMGRVMRLHKDKGDKVHVFDLVDVFTYKRESYSLRHFFQRESYYSSEGHPTFEHEILLEKYKPT